MTPVKTVLPLSFFLALLGSAPVVASPAAPSAAEGAATSLAERLSGIERAMWERDAKSIPALRLQASKDASEKVRARALGALTLLGDTGEPMVYLERLSSDPSPRVRRAAADAIGTLVIRPDRIGRISGPLQKDTDPMVRAECARALGKLDYKEAGGPLMYALSVDPSPEVRSLAAEALHRLRAGEAEPILGISARQDPSPTVRVQAVRALAGIAPVSSRSLFETIWKEAGDPDVRLEAYRALVGSADGGRWVEEGLTDAEVSVRFLALRTWSSRIVSEAREKRLARTSAEVVRLGNFLKDSARGIREFSRRTLEELGFKTRPDGFAYSIDDR